MGWIRVGSNRRTGDYGEVLERRIPVDTWLHGARTATLTIETNSPVERVSIDPENLFPDIDLVDNDWIVGQDQAVRE